jgi:hypothetical protein
LISSVALAAWTFKFPTIVQDTSGANRTYYPVDLGYNAATLLSSGKIAANGLNTNMQVGGTDVAYMMDTTRVMAVVPTLGADAMATVDLYTGYTPNQTSFDVVVGEGGYITTADDDDIELGSSFDITLDGYFVTSAAFVGENILYKQDSFRIYVQAAGTIRAAILSGGDVEEKAVDGAVSSGVHVVRIYTSGSTLSFGLDGSRIAHTHLDSSVTAGDELATTTSTVYLQYSATHHSFYANGRYWIFWGKDSQVDYQSSVDGDTWTARATALSGVTWANDRSDFITDGTYVYMVYHDSTPNKGYFRKGTLNSDGSITWLAVASQVADFTYRPPVLAVDSYGDIYCAYVNESDGFVYLDKLATGSDTWVSAAEFPKKSGIGPGGHITDPTYAYITPLLDGKIMIGGAENGTALTKHTQIWTGSAFEAYEHATFNWAERLESIGDEVFAVRSGATTNVYKYTYGVGWAAATSLGDPGDSNSGDDAILGVDGSTYDVFVSRYELDRDIVYYKKYDYDSSTWDVNWTTLSDESVDKIYDVGLDMFVSSSTDAPSRMSVSFWTREAGIGDYKIKCAFINLNDNPVPDTANDYVLMDGDTMPYASEISFDVAGTEVLLYKPNTIVVDTALPDRATADDSQDGVITWGSNSDITITYGLMEGGSGAPTPITPSDTAGFDPGEAAMPDAWFGTCTNASNLPFYDSFYEVSTQTGQSVCDIYFLIMVGVAFGTFLLLTMTTRSALIGVTGFNIILYAASSTGMVPMWIPFATTVVQVGVMFLYKQVAY